MNTEQIRKIFADTAYVRTGGSDAELKCAEYLKACCGELGLEAHLEPFAVDMASIRTAMLEADGEQIPCKGYLCAGSGTVEAPLCYLPHADRYTILTYHIAILRNMKMRTILAVTYVPL